jgi:hypothetical protein
MGVLDLLTDEVEARGTNRYLASSYGTLMRQQRSVLMLGRWPYTTNNKRFVILGERLRLFHNLLLGRFFKEPEDILEAVEKLAAEKHRDKAEGRR